MMDMIIVRSSNEVVFTKASLMINNLCLKKVHSLCVKAVFHTVIIIKSGSVNMKSCIFHLLAKKTKGSPCQPFN